MTQHDQTKPIFVSAGTGKVGKRIVQNLQDAGYSVRIGSRTAEPAFDWEKRSTWAPALAGARAAFVSYVPDLAVPGATSDIEAFCQVAEQVGVEHLVLLSGRGETEAQHCERIVQESGLNWTICRSGWFMQNLSEAFMRDMVLSGTIALPAGSIQEPFIDCDDIAEVASAALMNDEHYGQLYDLTGPELINYADIAKILSSELDYPVAYQPLEIEHFVSALAAQNVPENYQWLLRYLFTEVFDGRNAYLGDGVQRALGREPRSFASFAQKTAQEDAWHLNKELQS